jgi:NAD(P)-dependent dehydrogenase (short-subunit alcohol dehydrogenase family)
VSEQFGKSRGITVNSVAPGPVPTDRLPPEARSDPNTAKTLASMMEVTRAANRLGTVEDIADITLLLVSEKARWITGQHIDASGGMTGQ